MKTHLTPYLKRALLTSMSLPAISLTCSIALADNENYDGRNLDGEDFYDKSLNDSSWVGTSLVGANFLSAELARANFTGADMRDAYFRSATLTDANFSGALIQGAEFYFVEATVGASSSRNITQGMLMSTQSYKDKDFSRAHFDTSDFTGFDFSGMNLTGTDFELSNFTEANLSNATIRGTNFNYIVGNDPVADSDHTVTHNMLRSTRSHAEKDFSGVQFALADLSGFDFSEMNLAGANLRLANLSKAVLSKATIQGANLAYIVGNDPDANSIHTVTHDMLRSTQSYEDGNFSGVDFALGDLSGFDFSDMDLTHAIFYAANLSGATLTDARIQGVNLAEIVGNTSAGYDGYTVTHDMLRSTKSFKEKDFSGINFNSGDLSGFDLSGMDLTGASFEYVKLTGANLQDAMIRGASFAGSISDSSENSTRTVTHEMLRSTKSFKDKDFSDISFRYGELQGFDFSDMNLTGASFADANLTGAILTGATIQDTIFLGIVGNDPAVNSRHTVTHEMLRSTKSYTVDKDFSRIHFWYTDFNSFDFSGMNLHSSSFYDSNLQNANMKNASFINASFTYADLSGAQLSGADLREAGLDKSTGFNADEHQNLILVDGRVHQISLSTADDSLTIRGGTSINAYLDATTASIEGGATLTLTQNGVMELRNNTQLTLEGDGNLQLVFDASDPTSMSSIMIEQGSSITLAADAILDITINNITGGHFEAHILSWEADADVVDLLARLEDGTGYRINGKTLGELGLKAIINHETNTFSLIIPEPSTATLSLLALTGLLARRRRSRA